MSGSLASLTPDQQIEAIYIAYYGRAADVGGDVYWLNRLATLTSAPYNLTVQEAAVNISESFGTSAQAETVATYAFFQAPPVIPIADPANPPPAVAGEIDAFLTSVYQDLFNRAPDASGEAYWSQQILSGAVTVGASVYDIANGADAADAAVLAAKVEAASYFTSTTGAANLGTTPPLSSSFLAAAHASVVNVVDSTTEAASQAATNALVLPTTTIYLTPSIDNLTGPSGNDIFFAQVISAPALAFGLQNTLNSGDTLTGSSNGDNVLQAELTPLYVALPGESSSYTLSGYIPGEGDSGNNPFAGSYSGLTVYYSASTESYFYGVNSVYAADWTYSTYFVRPILNNIQTFEITQTAQPEGYYFGATVDLSESASVTNVIVNNSSFGDFTWLNAGNVTDVTLSGSADSAIFLFPNGGPAFPDPTNAPLEVTTASITNSNSGGIVFGFEASGVQYGEDVKTLTLNVTNSPSAWYDIYGYSNDEPLGGPATIDLNITSSNSSTSVPRPGAVPPQGSQTQIDPDNLWLYDHALSNFTKPILSTLNIDSQGQFEVNIPETQTGELSSTIDRNTFLDITALTVTGGPLANGSGPGELDLTADTFGSSEIGDGIQTQDGFQHFRNLKTVDASTYTGNLDLNIGWSDFGISGGSANSLSSIKLGSGDNHLDLISEYSTVHYSVTTGNGNNVVLFGYNNLTAAVTVTGGTGNNTLGVTNGDELNNSNTANVTGFNTLEIVGAAEVGSGRFGGINDYNLAAIPGDSLTSNSFFTTVTLTAYFNPGFDTDTAGTNSSGTNLSGTGGYFRSPTTGVDAAQSTNGSVAGGLTGSTDYVLGGDVLLWNAPTTETFTITNYADDSSAHRLSTGTHTIGVALASTVYGDTGVLDLNFHNIDFAQDGIVTSASYWQYVENLQLDYSSALFGDEGHNYATLNLNVDSSLPAQGAAATAYVDEINYLGAYGLGEITVTGNATLWIDHLNNQTAPLTQFDAHTDTGNIGGNYNGGTYNWADSGTPIVDSAHLGYLDLNHGFANQDNQLEFDSSQGLNFVQVEGEDRTDSFYLLGGNNQILVDNDHVGNSTSTSLGYDTFTYYAPGTDTALSGFENTVPHILAGDGNGAITLAKADSTNAAAPNTNVATIYGFEAGVTTGHTSQVANDIIALDGFNFPTDHIVQNLLDITNANVISTTSDLTTVAGLFQKGASIYAVAEYAVTAHDVFVFVNVDHTANFSAADDMVVHLVNTAHDIALTTGNFSFT